MEEPGRQGGIRVGEAVRPQFADIDVWGLTHVGKVRQTNQDHYCAQFYFYFMNLPNYK